MKRTRKSSLLLGGARKSERSSEKLFEFFFVVGTTPDNQPITLFKYPEDKEYVFNKCTLFLFYLIHFFDYFRVPYESEVLRFSLPEGAQKRKVQKSGSCTSLNELLFGQVNLFICNFLSF